jgi:hypothetical protein
VLRAGFAQLHPEDAQEDDSVIKLSTTDIMNFYRHTVTGTLQLVDSILTLPSMAACTKVMLVGGVCTSVYFQKAIRKHIPAHIELIVPELPSAAIVVGATLVCRHPRIFASHFMTKSIGIAWARLLKPTDPPHFRRSKANGKDIVVDIFDPFVKIGDRVAHDACVEREYAFGSAITCRVYSCDRPDAQCVTDPGMKLLGSLPRISQASHPQIQSKRVRVRFYFGRSVIEAHILAGKDDPRPEFVYDKCFLRL